MTPAHDAPDGYTVAFMRHPVARALSAWHNLLQEGTVVTPMMLKAGFQWGCTFRRFVEDLYRLRHRNKHTISQHEFLPERVDRLYTVEALPQAWRLLAGRFGLPALPRINTSPRMDAPAGLCDEIIDMYDVDYRLWHG